jgi:CopZ-like zinc binding protein
MSECCYPEKRLEPTETRCPQNGAIGRSVDRWTVKALLTEEAMRRLTRSDYRFCADADCDVVYFDANGSFFGTKDIRVPVWQKLPFGSRRMCYCFGESEVSIGREIQTAGRSSAVERIREHIAAGRCACEIRNPRGACCLGDVIAAIKRVEGASRSGVAAAGEALGDIHAGQRDFLDR